MTTLQPWIFHQARCISVVDGDTFDAEIDLGFRLWTNQRFRLKDVNAPELHSPNARERECAIAATAYLRNLILYRNLEIRSWRTPSFDRWVADVWLKGPDGTLSSLAMNLLDGGWVITWNGKGEMPRPWQDPNYTYPHISEPA